MTTKATAKMLNPRETQFVAALCSSNFNAAAAYTAAGYSGSRHAAARLCRKPRIQEAVKLEVAKRAARVEAGESLPVPPARPAGRRSPSDVYVPVEKRKNHMAANVRLHKDAEGFVGAMSTNATSEEDFLAQVCDVLQAELRSCVFDEELAIAGGGPKAFQDRLAADLDQFGFVVARTLPKIVDICCKLRGYKADVAEHRIIVAGRIVPADVVGVYETHPLAASVAS